MEEVPIQWIGLIYPFQRILLVMAHVAAIVLLYKSGFFQGLFRRLEAVGQMAFTNYIMHSVICTLFFFGYGLNYFARAGVLPALLSSFSAIWILQLIVSPLWLRYFLLRSARMALAEPDLLEVAAIPQKAPEASEPGETSPPGS